MGLSGVVAIAAGGRHTVALKRDGKIVAWGSNDSGQSSVPEGLSNAVAIAAGDNHTVVIGSLPPSIALHPESRTVTVGQSVSFSVTARGSGPLKYH